MACPICKNQSKNFSVYVKDYEYNIKNIALYYQCKYCKTIYRKKPKNIKKKKLRLIYSKEKYLPLKGSIFYDFFKRIYSGYEKKKITKHIGEKFFEKNKTILDIACGKGFLIENFSKYENLKCFGSDININTIKKNNVKFIKASFNNSNLIKKIKPDIIIINNFIEHIENLKDINKIINKMKKKSYLIIFTPDGNSLARKKFLNYWSGFHSPRHKIIFNAKSIKIFFSSFKKISFKQTKVYDPFTNLISFFNILKQIKYKVFLSDIFKIFYFPFFILIDFIRNNRLLIILKKN